MEKIHTIRLVDYGASNKKPIDGKMQQAIKNDNSAEIKKLFSENSENENRFQDVLGYAFENCGDNDTIATLIQCRLSNISQCPLPDREKECAELKKFIIKELGFNYESHVNLIDGSLKENKNTYCPPSSQSNLTTAFKPKINSVGVNSQQTITKDLDAILPTILDQYKNGRIKSVSDIYSTLVLHSTGLDSIKSQVTFENFQKLSRYHEQLRAIEGQVKDFRLDIYNDEQSLNLAVDAYKKCMPQESEKKIKDAVSVMNGSCHFSQRNGKAAVAYRIYIHANYNDQAAMSKLQEFMVKNIAGNKECGVCQVKFVGLAAQQRLDNIILYLEKEPQDKVLNLLVDYRKQFPDAYLPGKVLFAAPLGQEDSIGIAKEPSPTTNEMIKKRVSNNSTAESGPTSFSLACASAIWTAIKDLERTEKPVTEAALKPQVFQTFQEFGMK